MIIACLGPGSVHAQSPTTADEALKKLEAKRYELENAEKRTKWLQNDVAEINAERDRINTQLLDTAALIQKSEGKMSAIEVRLGEYEADAKRRRTSLAARHGEIAKLLGALQRMGRNPPPVMVTRRADALEMVRSAMLLASAFPEMKDSALALAKELDDLLKVMTEIKTDGERLKSETTRLNDERTKLASLMSAKKRTLAERQAELEQVRRSAAEIARNVGDLNELIARLDKAVTSNTGLGAYEQEVKREAAKQAALPAETPSPGSPAPSTGGSPPADKGTQIAALGVPKPSEMIELAPSAGSLVPGNPSRIKPAIPFQSAKERLPMPAQGRQVLAFGEKTQFGGQSKGIVLETRAGAQITSPCDGWIVYAGEFRSYGQLLIINAGGGYHILLAGLSQIDVQPGQFVLAAEPIGTMSGSASVAQVKPQSSTPVLYVEFRHEGKPIDPNPWWVAGHQKVQG